MLKNRSKITIMSLATSLAMVANVSAVGGDVLTLEAAQDATSGVISVSGTTDPDVVAISCALTDSEGTEVFFASSPVDAGAFEGEFTMPIDNYTLKCANYDGGEWVSVEIASTPVPDTDGSEEEPGEEPEEGAPEEKDSSSPDTGRMTSEGASGASDNIMPIVAGSLIALMALVSAGVVIYKHRKNQ